jgi:hypothetical protein
MDRQVIEVKWEPSAGNIYSILFRKMLEIYAVEDEKPKSCTIFDIISTSFDYISPSQICVSNEQGNFTILKNITSDHIGINIIHTKFPRIRQVKTCFDGTFQFLSSISTDCKLAIWSCDKLSNFTEDLEELKADRVVKSKTRLTSIAINNFGETTMLGKREREESSEEEEESCEDPSEGSEDPSSSQDELEEKPTKKQKK